MKKSFSILEIIFIITVIAIFITIAIPKLFDNLSQANLLKLKSDIALIKSGIKQYKQKQLLANQNNNLENLEQNNNLLFEYILTKPIRSNTNSSGAWSKSLPNRYKAWVNSTQFVTFIYNPTTSQFNCDKSQSYCKELSQ